MSAEETKASCLASLVRDEEHGGCSEADARYAHVSIAVFALTSEWQVDKALHHFVAATRLEGGGKEELPAAGGGKDRGVEWGPIWLTQVNARASRGAIPSRV